MIKTCELCKKEFNNESYHNQKRFCTPCKEIKKKDYNRLYKGGVSDPVVDDSFNIKKVFGWDEVSVLL